MQHFVLIPSQPWGLPLHIKLLPQYLKDEGYKTHAVGKWHLGHFTSDYTPEKRGFDSHFGYWGGRQDYYDHTAPESVRESFPQFCRYSCHFVHVFTLCCSEEGGGGDKIDGRLHHFMYEILLRVVLQKLPQLSDTHCSQVLNKLEKNFFMVL